MEKLERREFIGLPALIIYSGRKFEGTIIDETKNTLMINTPKGVKTIIKKNATIFIHDCKVNGETIAKRPEDRIKK